jgi:hypothetical protein
MTARNLRDGVQRFENERIHYGSSVDTLIAGRQWQQHDEIAASMTCVSR